ncbi:MAG: hypothetical protein S4CHLAM102_02240 [Chlamydiia bacterium]|nr:hypothetical protein [Chlamydiia bacterium]
MYRMRSLFFMALAVSCTVMAGCEKTSPPPVKKPTYQPQQKAPPPTDNSAKIRSLEERKDALCDQKAKLYARKQSLMNSANRLQTQNQLTEARQQFNQASFLQDLMDQIDLKILELDKEIAQLEGRDPNTITEPSPCLPGGGSRRSSQSGSQCRPNQ